MKKARTPSQNKQSSRLWTTAPLILLFAAFFGSVSQLAATDVGHQILKQIEPHMPEDIKSILPFRPPEPVAAFLIHGSKAPEEPKSEDGGIIVFVRHVGCPFAEKSLLDVQNAARRHPKVQFTVVTHASPEVFIHHGTWWSNAGQITRGWVKAISGDDKGLDNLKFESDEERRLWARWGIQDHRLYELLTPTSITELITLGKEGITNRRTQSASRYARAAAFAVDHERSILWSWQGDNVSDVPNLEDAVEAYKKMK
ncbi:hypothetical protein PROFUN_15280 [Planoprotostelium fungivorum]|uniref:Thioredoxin domain-containing protein n=1 Tax=Planoprotostelium fungivorum TaxID=1890364 RepID=A0A2P6MXD9_9EUKA|nr:hypothetical protein PROFUN_15280 [Planoprotostelium fungivorum]